MPRSSFDPRSSQIRASFLPDPSPNSARLQNISSNVEPTAPPRQALEQSGTPVRQLLTLQDKGRRPDGNRDTQPVQFDSTRDVYDPGLQDGLNADDSITVVEADDNSITHPAPSQHFGQAQHQDHPIPVDEGPSQVRPIVASAGGHLGVATSVPSIALTLHPPVHAPPHPSVSVTDGDNAILASHPSVPCFDIQMASFRSADPVIAAEEQRGLEHIRQMQQRGETFVPIADDHWEDPRPDDEEIEVGADDQGHLHDDADDISDPFQYKPSPARPLRTPADIHPNRAVSIIYLVVLWLHSQFHLAFRACAALLVVLSIAFRAAGSPIEPAMFTTLPSVIKELNADASMKVCPVCPACFKVFPATTPHNSSCDRCEHPLFETKDKHSSKQQHPRSQQTPKPLLQFPTKSIEDYLTTILAVPGMEDEMDAWKKKTRRRGIYKDIFDGDVCQTIPGVDGSPFFHPADDILEPDELRIGVSLGADW